MAKLLVYGHPVSQPTRAVMWALLMKGVPFEQVRVQPHKIDDAYLLKFPAGTFPCIEEVPVEGAPFRLQESHAILTYLADRHGWADLYPQDLQRRAVVNQWLHWHHHALRPATGHFFRPMMHTYMKSREAGKGPQFAKVWDMPKEFHRGRAVLRDSFLTMKYGAFVDGASGKRIPGAAFLCGEKPTVADVAAYCELDQLEAMGVLEALGPAVVPAEITEWMGRMKALPLHDEVRAPLRKFLGFVDEEPQTKAAVQAGLDHLRSTASKL